MRIVAADDEELSRRALKSAIEKASPDAEIIIFSKGKDILDYLTGNDADIAFLDINMGDMLGTALAKKIKLVNPGVQIIFATGYDSYMGDAFSLHAAGYILKPITAKKVKAELDNLSSLTENITKNILKESKRVRFQCFGNFDVFIDSKPVSFKYDKTKEVLAYIVSRRGALCSNAEVCTNVWDDDLNHESYFRGLKKDLLDTLRPLCAEKIILSQKGKIGIDATSVSCDYYDFLAGNPAAINLYRGEFMSQYSWGEMTNAELEMSRTDSNER